MRGIVLAAGKGSRLAGITAPYMKPLLVVNGRPLIVSIVESLLGVTDQQPTVVVAPENARPVYEVLNAHHMNNIDLVVQAEPKGPGHALYLGMRAGGHDTGAIAVMGDNDLGHDDLGIVKSAYVESQGEAVVVGTAMLHVETCERFTRWRPGPSVWVEKVPVNQDDRSSSEFAQCWVGPIALPVYDTMQIMAEDFESATDMGIGPYFNEFNRSRRVIVNSRDIGIPTEALA